MLQRSPEIATAQARSPDITPPMRHAFPSGWTGGAGQYSSMAASPPPAVAAPMAQRDCLGMSTGGSLRTPVQNTLPQNPSFRGGRLSSTYGTGMQAPSMQAAVPAPSPPVLLPQQVYAQPLQQGSSSSVSQWAAPARVLTYNGPPNQGMMQNAGSPYPSRAMPCEMSQPASSYAPPPQQAQIPVPVATVREAQVIGYEVHPQNDVSHPSSNPHSVEFMTQQSPADNEFMRLLDSLEVRVDLMAQMQHTRNQIQARAEEINDPVPEFHGPGDYEMEQEYMQPAGLQELANEIADVKRELAQGQHRHGFRGNVEDMGLNPNQMLSNEARLQKENSDLWGQLGEQRDVIAKMTMEVETLRGQLASLGLTPGGDADDLRVQLQAVVARARESDEECRRHRDRAKEIEQKYQVAEQEWLMEKESLHKEITSLLRGLSKEGTSRAASPVRGDLGIGRTSSFSPVRNSMGTTDGRRGLTNLLDPNGNLTAAALTTTPVLPAATDALQHSPSPPPVLPHVLPAGHIAPFSRSTFGVNVALSEDGYTATRKRGCRQSVLVGSAPLPLQQHGYYFEVEIRETVEGWVGGLGLGITRTGPDNLRRVPDKAWRMPNTFIVGYWGCVFLDGKEMRTKWRADTLVAGSRVGLLLSGNGSGDLRVFVGGEAVVTVEGALKDHVGCREFYPVIDVFAATLSVTLLPSGTPPPPPWTGEVSVLQEPGSPGGTSSIGTGKIH